MRLSSSAFLALLLPLTASAGGRDRIEAPVGAAELSGTVTVDLLADPAHQGNPMVWGLPGEDEGTQSCLVALAGGPVSNISGDLADKLELKRKKVKTKGGEFEVVTLPVLKVGELTLRDLTAVVPKTMTPDTCVSLSLSATGLAWAVTPSQGKVHLAPAEQGAGLVSQVGGTSIPTTTTETGRVKFGKQKYDLASAPTVAQGTLGGQSVSLAIGYGYASNVSSDVTIEGPARKKGDRTSTWAAAVAGGLELGSTWLLAEPGWRHIAGGAGEPVTWGMVGTDLLAAFDVAVDPVASTMALKPAPDQVRADPRPTLLANAKADLDKCLNPTEPLEGDAAEKPAGERCGGQYGALAGAALGAGDLQASLDARRVLAEVSPGKCDAWSALGELQLATGDVAAARASFEKAAAQYHAWWDLDAWKRDDAQAAFDDLEEDQQKVAEVQPQAASCHVADGMAALAALVAGDEAAVASIYQDRLDLDPNLASVMGAHLIMKDQVEQAHGPWRMVDHLTVGPAVVAKAGLGRLFAQQGDWASALVNYQAALAIDPGDATVTAMWVDDLAGREGADVALDEARKWAAQRPDSLAARLGVARAAKAAGKDPGFLTSEADPIFEARIAIAPLDVNALSTYARYLAATGRTERAGKTAERALKADPSSPHAWLAQAEVAQAKGDAAQARDSLLRAAQVSGAHPGYTLLLQQAR